MTRFTLDSTGPLLDDDRYLYRAVALREQGETFRDFVKHDRWLVAPSLAWQPEGGNAELVASLEYVRDRRRLDSGVEALPGGRRLPRDRFLGEPGTGVAEIDGVTMQLTGRRELGRTWSVDASVPRARASTARPPSPRILALGH